MPQPFSISVTDQATPELRRLLRDIHSEAFYAVLGRRAERVLHRHFAKKDRTGNRRGWWRSHFWSRIRRATAFSGASRDDATITIADPAFAAKVRGAKGVRAKESKMLALPLTSEAKRAGRPKAGLIPGVFLVRTKKGAFLVTASYEKGPRGLQRQRLKFLWRLVASVDIPADPTALPPQSEMDAELLAQANEWYRRRYRST